MCGMDRGDEGGWEYPTPEQRLAYFAWTAANVPSPKLVGRDYAEWCRASRLAFERYWAAERPSPTPAAES